MTNPFEAPLHGSGGGPGAAGDLDVFLAYSQGWGAVQRNLVVWLGALLAGALAVLVSEVMCFFPVFVVGPAVLWGMMRFNLEAIDGEARFETAFSGFERLGDVVPPFLIAMLAHFAAVFFTIIPLVLVQVVLSIVDNSVLSLVVGLPVAIVFYVALIVLSVRLGLWPYLIADRNLGGVDALTESWRLTEGRTLQLVGLALLAVPVALVGMLACFVGLFPATMVIYGAQASAYRQLTGGLRA